MQQRYDVLGFGLICVAGALFAVAGMSDTLFTDQSWFYRWQGLIGALLGAIGTIIGGGIAYLGVQHQLSHAAAQTTDSQESAKQAATLALSQPVHAASMVLHVLRRAANAMGSVDQGNADREVGIAVAQLERTLQHFSLRELVLDLQRNGPLIVFDGGASVRVLREYLSQSRSDVATSRTTPKPDKGSREHASVHRPIRWRAWQGIRSRWRNIDCWRTCLAVVTCRKIDCDVGRLDHEWQQGRSSMASGVELRAQMDVETYKGLLAVNGGGVVALLGFLAAILNRAGTTALIKALLVAVLLQIFGLAAAIVHNHLRRRCSLIYETHGMRPPNGTILGLTLGQPTVCFFGWGFMWLSLALFVTAGLVVAIVGLWTLT